MNLRSQRRRQVLQLAAEKAYGLPRLASGFWFHQDMRDNLYYALHLYAACAADDTLRLNFPREEGLKLAENMLLAVLGLQNKEPEHPMFGHWPLNLHPEPQNAPAHTLPVELLGSLLAWYHAKFGPLMGRELEAAFRETLRCVYLGSYYRQPVHAFNHHESKYTAQQLIWGERFDDRELAEEGKRNLKRMLGTVRANGMREYGALPWFWHWIQSFTFARELVRDGETAGLLDEMLEYLWRIRASVYLKGAWVGPHSRVLPHDVPADRNNLIDYVVFGDFTLPGDILRLEAAGLLEPMVDEQIIRSAVERTEASEVKRLIPIDPEHVEAGCLHGYAYVTPEFAVGGVWERAEEYLNEQHRWDATLPAQADGRANQAFFLHPGAGFESGDPRHQSGFSQVLLHENTAAALYALSGTSEHTLVGCLPLGEWRYGKRRLTGQIGGVYLLVTLMQDYTAETLADRMEVRSSGLRNGVVLEALDAATAEARGWRDLTAVAEAAETLAAAEFTAAEDGTARVAYRSLAKGDILVLAVSADAAVAERTINGADVTFADYSVPV